MAASARAEMLIRRPVDEVFEALVKPALLRKYWLNKASAPLGEGVSVDWEFLVPGATEVVTVTRFVQAEQIAFEWSNGNCVDIRFYPTGRSSTRVKVEVTGFSGRDTATQAVAATEGFAIVLCDLKSLLETGSSGKMVRDKAALIASGLKK